MAFPRPNPGRRPSPQLPAGTGPTQSQSTRRAGSDSAAAASMETLSTQQQSSRYESSSFNSQNTTSASESSVESIATSDVIYEEYIQLGVVGLAGCTLTLDGTKLTIEWRVPDKLTGNSEKIVDLDDYVANISGKLVWGRGSGFSTMCKNGSIRLAEKTVLIASCLVIPGGSDYRDARLDLNDYFAFTRTGFEPNMPDPEFDEFISAASWMNFTLVSQANMSMFLQNPAFQKAVSSVARRAVEVSNMQTYAVVQQMVKKLETINANSEVYIARQMAAFVKSAAESAAAYAALTQLTMMMTHQKTAYETFYSSLDPTSPGTKPDGPGQLGMLTTRQTTAYETFQSSTIPPSRS
ncbi:hypothetical protein B0H19DRAFT_1071514 [Mycena capillaripes]|nr:hypothetical protein B0H19DRAFT_1071514 [Mycena capillaripes]